MVFRIAAKHRVVIALNLLRLTTTVIFLIHSPRNIFVLTGLIVAEISGFSYSCARTTTANQFIIFLRDYPNEKNCLNYLTGTVY